MIFTKMHGLGNDFIVVDNLEAQHSPEEMAKKAPSLCHRHFGIGADGLVLLNTSREAPFAMQIFNPDGSEAEMCGNAIRCLGKYVWDRKMINGDRVSIQTGAGIMELALNIQGSEVKGIRVNMGQPILDSQQIPVAGPERKVIDEPITAGDKTFKCTAVSMGNPHCIIFVDSLEDIPWKTWGPLLENHSMFPRRTNVEFVEILGPGEVRVNVWERGAGPTLACGTGACATTVAGVITGRLEENVVVHLPGGTLTIQWKQGQPVYMEGPAEEVYRGEVSLERIQ